MKPIVRVFLAMLAVLVVSSSMQAFAAPMSKWQKEFVQVLQAEGLEAAMEMAVDAGIPLESIADFSVSTLQIAPEAVTRNMLSVAPVQAVSETMALVGVTEAAVEQISAMSDSEYSAMAEEQGISEAPPETVMAAISVEASAPEESGGDDAQPTDLADSSDAGEDQGLGFSDTPPVDASIIIDTGFVTDTPTEPNVPVSPSSAS